MKVINFFKQPIVLTMLGFFVLAGGLFAGVYWWSFAQQQKAEEASLESAIAKAHSLQAEAFKSGGFALMTIPGPENYISTTHLSGIVNGKPEIQVGEIDDPTIMFRYWPMIQLLDKDGHPVDQFGFDYAVVPGDLVIAWYVDPSTVRPGKYPKSFLGTLPRYWNPDTGFAVSIIHSVVETP